MSVRPHLPHHRWRPLALAAALLAAQAALTNAAAAPAEPAIEIQQAALPLDRALVQLAARTGLLIGVDAALVRERQAPALNGRYTPPAALRALLEGSRPGWPAPVAAVAAVRAGETSTVRPQWGGQHRRQKIHKLTKCSLCRRLPPMAKKTPEQKLLLDQLKQVAEGLAQTFAPFTEVVVHDLLDPAHAVLAIHNNLSGRQPGDPATELGLARILDPGFDQILANYPNRFADGRQVKSTSIGIKDSQGRYIAALCMNVDLSLFQGFQGMLSQFASAHAGPVQESLDPAGAEAIRVRIDQFAAKLATTPRALKADDRRALLKELKASGLLEVRRAMETVAGHLGVSRAAVYGYAK